MLNVSFHTTNSTDIDSIASASACEVGGLYLNTSNHRLYYATDDDNVIEIGTNPNKMFTVGENSRTVSICGNDVAPEVSVYDTVGGYLRTTSSALESCGPGFYLGGYHKSLYGSTITTSIAMCSNTYEGTFSQSGDSSNINQTITIPGIVFVFNQPTIVTNTTDGATYTLSLSLTSVGVVSGQLVTRLAFTAAPDDVKTATVTYKFCYRGIIRV